METDMDIVSVDSQMASTGATHLPGDQTEGGAPQTVPHPPREECSMGDEGSAFGPAPETAGEPALETVGGATMTTSTSAIGDGMNLELEGSDDDEPLRAGTLSLHPSQDSPRTRKQHMNRQGYLEIRSGSVLRTWQRRYIVLEESKLTVYKHHTDVGLKFSKEIEVGGCRVYDASSGRNIDIMEFELCLPSAGSDQLTARANSVEERAAWVGSLRYCVAVLNRRQNVEDISVQLVAQDGDVVPKISSESVNIEDFYEMGEVLGAGVAGTVYRAVHRSSGEQCAIKVLSKRKFLHTARANTTTRREIEILTLLSERRHPHVVQLKAIIENVASIYIVMEVVDGGELFQHIVSMGSYSERDAANVTRILCETVKFLHKHGIVHRDLKPEVRPPPVDVLVRLLCMPSVN
jgi:hypothetical protein